MKKFLAAVFIFSLFVFAAGNSFAQQTAEEEKQTVKDFNNDVLDEFKSVNDPSLSYPVVTSRIEEYSREVSKLLAEGKIGSDKAAMVMGKAGSWYGQALEVLFNGNDFNEVIQDYSAKIADLFNKEHLDLNLQMSILSLTSDELEQMDFLFSQLTDNPSGVQE